jgi:tRNA modification GTPase
MKIRETIVARVTPLGTGGVAIVRLSGPDAVAIAARFCRPDSFRSLSAVPVRYMALAAVSVGADVLDRCLVVRFEGPRSFSGEDIVEFHLHGTQAIVDRVIELSIDSGARLAEPGEFTRQAFFNGKMDLTQVEALADVIATESERALFLAQRQLHGEFRRKLQNFRDQIIHLLACLELELDFVEEGYVFASEDEFRSLIEAVRSFAAGLIDEQRRSRYLRSGPRILLLGKPNAGKSSLFNALVGYGRAIVSPEAGTTRDYLEEKIFHAGLVFHFIDTAGLRETEDSLEATGVERARELVDVCDHVLYLIDSSVEDLANELAAVAQLGLSYPGLNVTPVLTKSDLCSSSSFGRRSVSVFDPVSVKALLDYLVSDFGLDQTEQLTLISQRQVMLLREIVLLVDDIRELVSVPTEVLSLQLRALLRPLSELTGAVVNEDILNRIFSSFCIGK